ncbi:MAG: beta-propeller fold lactonase family protein [Verrucomicrobiales bacterium]|nr:beta-propeller fold lactonase family protein [Verrucomicrobiales bacterium]
MKFRIVLSLFLLAGLVPFSKAEEPLPHDIFAPSRKGSSLLWLMLSPSKDSEKPSASEMHLRETIDLGFGARTITQHSEKPILYISGGFGEETGSNFAAVFLNEETREVQKIERMKVARDYSYVSLDREKKFLFGCSYGEGIIDVYRLDENGVPNPEPVESLQEGRKAAHCVLVSPDNRHIYIPYVKEHNALFQYAFEAKTGGLKALDPKNANPPEKTGPRHLAYHPKLPLLYFSEEQGLGVSIYKRAEDGQLAYWKSASAVGDGAPEDGVSASDILMTPNGKFVYTGIRGHKHDFDFIAGYAVQDDGNLKPLKLTATEKIPWGLAVTKDSRFLVVTAFKGGKILAYQIGEDGALTQAAELAVDENISDVEIR